MEYGLFDFLKLIGSLGVFLYGMKLMSEALQKVAGERMRHILSAMTSNRVKGVVTGMLITAIIQSSSATTVMVVSFVNAGLLNLMESIGVIMGLKCRDNGDGLADFHPRFQSEHGRDFAADDRALSAAVVFQQAFAEKLGRTDYRLRSAFYRFGIPKECDA